MDRTVAALLAISRAVVVTEAEGETSSPPAAGTEDEEGVALSSAAGVDNELEGAAAIWDPPTPRYCPSNASSQVTPPQSLSPILGSGRRRRPRLQLETLSQCVDVGQKLVQKTAEFAKEIAGKEQEANRRRAIVNRCTENVHTREKEVADLQAALQAATVRLLQSREDHEKAVTDLQPVEEWLATQKPKFERLQQVTSGFPKL